MMNIDMLLNTIKNLVGIDVDVDVNEVQKGNVVFTGISIGDDKIRPCVYIENYTELFETDGYEAVAKAIIEECKNAKKYDFNIEDILSLDYAKDHLLLCISPKGDDSIVRIPYLDLDLYFRVLVPTNEDDGDDGIGSFKVKENMLEMWNITKEELLQIALNTNTYKAESMKEVMIEMMSGDMPREMVEALLGDAPDQAVLSNENRMHGASAIYNKELLKEVADKYESDLYIIPSSIHELIVHPVNNGGTVEDMNNMITEVNETQVSPEERLSDHVYVFHRDTMEIDW